MTTPTPETLDKLAHFLEMRGDGPLSASAHVHADAWQLQVDKIAGGIAVLGEENARLKARIEALEKALRRAEQTIRNAAPGFAAGDVRTILLNEASNCAAALAGEEKP